VYQEGLRRTVDAVVDRDAALDVAHDDGVRVAELPQPGDRVVRHVLPGEPDDRQFAGLREFVEHRMLDLAGRAPRAPDVEQPDLAAHRLWGPRAREVVRDRQ